MFPRLLPKIPLPFPEKMGICMRPSRAFESGGGGGVAGILHDKLMLEYKDVPIILENSVSVEYNL